MTRETIIPRSSHPMPSQPVESTDRHEKAPAAMSDRGKLSI
jgi:hypothetical protein